MIQVEMPSISKIFDGCINGLRYAETICHRLLSEKIMGFYQLLGKPEGVKNRPKSASNSHKCVYGPVQ